MMVVVPTEVLLGRHRLDRSNTEVAQACCSQYVHLTPVTYFIGDSGGGADWKLVWRCDVCKNILECEMQVQGSYPRISSAVPCIIPQDTTVIVHAPVDHIQLRNLLDGVDIFMEAHEQYRPVAHEIFPGSCPFCLLDREEVAGEDHVTAYKCHRCDSVYVDNGDYYSRYHGEIYMNETSNDDGEIDMSGNDGLSFGDANELEDYMAVPTPATAEDAESILPVADTVAELAAEEAVEPAVPTEEVEVEEEAAPMVETPPVMQGTVRHSAPTEATGMQVVITVDSSTEITDNPLVTEVVDTRVYTLRGDVLNFTMVSGSISHLVKQGDIVVGDSGNTDAPWTVLRMSRDFSQMTVYLQYGAATYDVRATL